MRTRLAQWMPTQEKLLANRWLRPIAGRMVNPALWRVSRRSVRLSVAIGVFSAFILPLGQIPLAIVIALSFRANLLVAATATLITNPITFPFIYFLAYRLGRFALAPFAGGPVRSEAVAASLHGMFAPLAIGLGLLAIAGAITGFVVTEIAWSCRVRSRWLARSRRI